MPEGLTVERVPSEKGVSGASGLLAKKQGLFSLLGLPEQTRGLDNSHLFCHSSESYKSKITVWAGLASLELILFGCPHGALPSACLCPNSSSYVDTSHIGLGPTLTTPV